jgi:hypothetical protein
LAQASSQYIQKKFNPKKWSWGVKGAVLAVLRCPALKCPPPAEIVDVPPEVPHWAAFLLRQMQHRSVSNAESFARHYVFIVCHICSAGE